MMEVKAAQISVIATERTCSAGLGDEDLLDLPSASHHCLFTASQATVGPPGLKQELGETVSVTTAYDNSASGLARLSCQTALSGGLCLQVILSQPVTHCSRASLERLGHGGDRCSRLDQLL